MDSTQSNNDSLWLRPNIICDFSSEESLIIFKESPISNILTVSSTLSFTNMLLDLLSKVFIFGDLIADSIAFLLYFHPWHLQYPFE